MSRAGKTVIVSMILVSTVLAVACGEHWKALKSGGSGSPPAAKRYSFEDILVPGELNLNEDESFVFEAGGITAGTLIFSGYVDLISLQNFFKRNMPRDGWRLKSEFRFPKLVLVFEKIGKTCIVEIFEKRILTRVEIWVAPSAG